MKYYVVKEGRIPGIYYTWEECQAQINGYSNAKYKSFKNKQDAEDFFNGENMNLNKIDVQNESEYEKSENLIAYVDGSYSDSIKAYGFGCVIIANNNIIQTFTGKNDNEDYIDMRNVAGEIAAAKLAIKYATTHGYKNVDIYYDYEGIEKWANGEWKAKKIGTKDYVLFVSKAQTKVNIKFYKVKAHSGNLYNEMADALAKEALGIN